MRPQPLIAVADVEESSRWYQRLLGCQSAHGGPEYERLVSGGQLVLQLHHWEEEHHHGPIGDRASQALRQRSPAVVRNRRLRRCSRPGIGAGRGGRPRAASQPTLGGRRGRTTARCRSATSTATGSSWRARTARRRCMPGEAIPEIERPARSRRQTNGNRPIQEPSSASWKISWMSGLAWRWRVTRAGGERHEWNAIPETMNRKYLDRRLESEDDEIHNPPARRRRIRIRLRPKFFLSTPLNLTWREVLWSERRSLERSQP